MIHPPPKCISVAEINLPISRAEKKKRGNTEELEEQRERGKEKWLEKFSLLLCCIFEMEQILLSCYCAGERDRREGRYVEKTTASHLTNWKNKNKIKNEIKNKEKKKYRCTIFPCIQVKQFRKNSHSVTTLGLFLFRG